MIDGLSGRLMNGLGTNGLADGLLDLLTDEQGERWINW